MENGELCQTQVTCLSETLKPRADSVKLEAPEPLAPGFQDRGDGFYTLFQLLFMDWNVSQLEPPWGPSSSDTHPFLETVTVLTTPSPTL